MEAELAALAASGATTVVGLMASDAWTQAKQRLARFFARDGDESAADGELELSCEELTAARDGSDERTAADIEADWRQRLRYVLRTDPAAADELRALLAELDPAAADGRGGGSVANTVSGGVQHGPIVQVRDVSGGMTFHMPGAVQPGPDAQGPR
ncbi:hypothetical protein AB0I22_15460 [Streptomyces sp. NPDC050610]|uniref:hypothetical protein n=1 Tax=Streptomyces sp. NPDC050610 TaxID=3157097 RepID=UPI003436F3AC